MELLAGGCTATNRVALQQVVAPKHPKQRSNSDGSLVLSPCLLTRKRVCNTIAGLGSGSETRAIGVCLVVMRAYVPRCGSAWAPCCSYLHVGGCANTRDLRHTPTPPVLLLLCLSDGPFLGPAGAQCEGGSFDIDILLRPSTSRAGRVSSVSFQLYHVTTSLLAPKLHFTIHPTNAHSHARSHIQKRPPGVPWLSHSSPLIRWLFDCGRLFV